MLIRSVCMYVYDVSGMFQGINRMSSPVKSPVFSKRLTSVYHRQSSMVTVSLSDQCREGRSTRYWYYYIPLNVPWRNHQHDHRLCRWQDYLLYYYRVSYGCSSCSSMTKRTKIWSAAVVAATATTGASSSRWTTTQWWGSWWQRQHHQQQRQCRNGVEIQ